MSWTKDCRAAPHGDKLVDHLSFQAPCPVGSCRPKIPDCRFNAIPENALDHRADLGRFITCRVCLFLARKGRQGRHHLTKILLNSTELNDQGKENLLCFFHQFFFHGQQFLPLTSKKSRISLETERLDFWWDP
jgi:hypothetical protein